MENLILTMLILSGSWSQTLSVVNTTSLPEEEITKMHYDVNPEFVEVIRLLVRMDKNALHTILENEAAFYQTMPLPMIFDAYNSSNQASYCATQEWPTHRNNIYLRKIMIQGIVDETLDIMHKKWGELQEQDELKDYFIKYWEERNALYDYVTAKSSSRECDDGHVMDQTCTVMESIESSFGDFQVALGFCKLK